MIACSSGEVWRRCFCVRRKRPDTVRTCVRYVSATLARNRTSILTRVLACLFPRLSDAGFQAAKLWAPTRLTAAKSRAHSVRTEECAHPEGP
jgi:hypothetical protein